LIYAMLFLQKLSSLHLTSEEDASLISLVSERVAVATVNRHCTNPNPDSDQCISSGVVATLAGEV